jgi:AAA family ATP:ADP antiporter
MRRTFNRLFNLRAGDIQNGGPFFLYYFLIIASYVMGQTARDALFLDRFKAVQLPYADIAIALIVGTVIAVYLRASRRLDVVNLTSASLLLLSLFAAGFWWAAHYQDWPWLYPVIYVWVGIFGVAATAQVWTLANVVWTTREAKRLFALLGSGGILGGIFGGFFSNFWARSFGTESLLLVASIFFLSCVFLVRLIGRQHGLHGEGVAQRGIENAVMPGVRQSLRIIRDYRLLQTIAVLICLCSVVTTVAGWQMKALAKEAIVEKDALAAFFGSFAGYTGVLALVAQLLITSRLMKRFGVGIALFVLPTALMFGSVGLLASGSLVAAVLLRGSDKVFRYSIDTSALQLLYLPVPTGVKLQAKSFIDTVIWRFGDGLAGLTVLLFATRLRWTPRDLGWLNVVLLIVWMGLAVYARAQYVGTLSSNIRHLQLDPDQNSAPVLDAITTNVLAEKLRSKDPAEVLYALNLFEMGQESQSHAAVQGLLEHSDAKIRSRATAILTASGDGSARALVAPLLKDEHLDVRTEALLYMTQHSDIDPLEHLQSSGDFADYSVRSAIVAFLSKPGENQNLEGARVILDGMAREGGASGQRTRLEAARLIGTLPDAFEPQLGQLLDDTDREVLRQAIRAVSTLKKRRWTPLLVERLGDPALKPEATDALLSFGESVAGTLRDYLGDESVAVETRREIPSILVRLGTPLAVRILANNVIQGDNVLRHRIISSLNKLLDLHKDAPMDAESIETVLMAEFMGYYRSCQLLIAAHGGDAEALKDSMKEDLERIFRLIKLLAPQLPLQNAYLSLQSKDPVTRSNALEYLDNTLKPQTRNLLVPLIDGDVSNAERARLAESVLGLKLEPGFQ